MTTLSDIASKVVRKFSDIGRTNGTKPLDSTDNRAAIAHELFIANQLRGLADKRYEAAKKEAFDAGILGEFSEFAPGTHLTYDNEHLSVSIRKSGATEMVDKKALVHYLTNHHPDIMEAILAACIKPRAGQTVIQIACKS